MTLTSKDYNTGYADAWDNGTPRLPDNAEYMAGYKQGGIECDEASEDSGDDY